MSDSPPLQEHVEAVIRDEDVRDRSSNASDMTLSGQRVVTNVRRRAVHQVNERPVATTVLTFVAGASLGAVVGSLLFDEVVRRRRASSSTIETMATRISELLSASLPDALQR